LRILHSKTLFKNYVWNTTFSKHKTLPTKKLSLLSSNQFRFNSIISIFKPKPIYEKPLFLTQSPTTILQFHLSGQSKSLNNHNIDNIISPSAIIPASFLPTNSFPCPSPVIVNKAFNRPTLIRPLPSPSSTLALLSSSSTLALLLSSSFSCLSIDSSSSACASDFYAVLKCKVLIFSNHFFCSNYSIVC